MNGRTVLTTPAWVRAVLLDILDAIGAALIHGFPLIVSVVWLICQLAEPSYTFL